MLITVTSVEKNCARTKQPMYYLPPGGIIAHSTRDNNKGVVNLHFLLDIPLDEVFTPYGLKEKKLTKKRCEQGVSVSHAHHFFRIPLMQLLPGYHRSTNGG
jgi:hypothetical protein